MKAKKQKINTKLKELGQKLGLDETTTLRSKRNMKTIIATAVFAVFLILLGTFLLPSGPAGYYYSGGSIRDFHLLFKGFF
jgi:hypothetical protein